jgi:hypothetical protein
MDMVKYNGRLVIIGPMGDVLQVSNSGDAESFDSITGLLQIPSEFDGNMARAGFELFGNLYITKVVGIFSTSDTGDPNTWTVNTIDGGVGSYADGIGTITGSQPGLSFNSQVLLANPAGIFLFNGNVQRPELTYKIQDLWDSINFGALQTIQVAIDVFNKQLYVIVPIGSSTPNTVIVGDWQMGLDQNNIRWSVWSFPWTVQAIAMMNFNDGTGDNGYYLRMGTNGTLYKYHSGLSNDNGAMISNFIQTAPIPITTGAYNIFRFLRFRITGSGTLLLNLADESGGSGQTVPQSPNVINLANYTAKDLGLQINYQNEKMIVTIGTNGMADNFKLTRLDIFGKARFQTRANG